LYEHVRGLLAKGLKAVARRAARVAGLKKTGDAVRAHRIEPLERLKEILNSLIIVGGTAAALGTILGCRHGDVVRRIELLGLFEKLRRMSVSQRVRRYHLPRGRADIVVAGAAILIAVAQLCGLDSLTISRRGLRHGVLSEAGG
jgi:exopolyphosphatase/pppGpp-phosphohydrolase